MSPIRAYAYFGLLYSTELLLSVLISLCIYTTHMDELKPIFRDLANTELLKKCLHGKSQTPNASVNNIIWSRIPKTVFVSLQTLNSDVYDAVSCFNRA